MAGFLKLMVAFALLIAAAYAVIFLWTGTLPEYGLQVLGTLAIITLASLAILFISRPTGERENP